MTPNKIYHFAFLLLLTAAAFCTLPWHQGFTVGDCAAYLDAAHDLLHGKWNIQNNFYANRIGTYLPYSIGMGLFGFGKWLTLITTIEFLLLLSLVYVIIGKYDRQVAWMSVCLLGLSPLLHQNAALIMGDMAATLTANGVLLCFFYFRFCVFQKENTSARWGMVTGLLFMISFLTKESVIFFIPLLAVLFWHDRNNTAMKMFWKYTIATLAVLGIVFVFIYWAKTGNPVYRLVAVEAGPSSSECNYVGAGAWVIFNRITWQPFLFLTENFTYGTLFLFSVLQVLLSYKSGSPVEKFFNVCFIGSLAAWWLGSQGFTSYNPVALVHRVWLPIVVPMAVSSSFFMLFVIKKNLAAPVRYKIVFTSLLYVAFTLLALFFARRNHALMHFDTNKFGFLAAEYLLVVLFLFSVLFFKNKTAGFVYLRWVLPLAVVGVLVLSSLQGVIWLAHNKLNAIRIPFDSEKEMLLYTLNQTPQKIITDNWVARGYHIYTGFDQTIPVIDYNDCDSTCVQSGVYLLLNNLRQQELAAGITETRTYIKANYQVSDLATHPLNYGFTLIRQNETNMLYRFTGHKL